jgi:nucleotide-binding universal stress UspA family protein
MVTMRTIMAAIDLSALSSVVMDYANSMALAWQAQLLAVHVVHDLAYFTGVYISDTPLPELQQRLETEAQERLQALCQSILDDRVTYEVVIVTGRPIVELHRLVREQQVDCLVMGTHSTDKPEHQLFGSTAERLIQQSACPILMVPPRKSSNFISHG